MLLIWIVPSSRKRILLVFLLGCVFYSSPIRIKHSTSFGKNQSQTIGGNGGGGIVEIPNLHGGQIDFNHVSVGKFVHHNLITYPNHIIYSNLDTCHKTHDDIPENQYYQADTAPKVVKISVWLISKAGNNHGDPNQPKALS
jgi:hypothetical protein